MAFFAAGSTIESLESARAAMNDVILQLGAAASVAGAVGVFELQKGLKGTDAKLDRVADEVGMSGKARLAVLAVTSLPRPSPLPRRH
jgi:hypothetical protein